MTDKMVLFAIAGITIILMFRYTRSDDFKMGSSTRIYNFRMSYRNFSLQPDSGQLSGPDVFQGNIYMKPIKSRPYTFSVGLYNLKTEAIGELASIKNIFRCTTFNEIRLALIVPIVAVYNKNGLLQHMEVDEEKEGVISQDIKLFLLYNLQVNASSLRRKPRNYTTITREPYFGSDIDFSYDIETLNSSEDLLKKTSNTEEDIGFSYDIETLKSSEDHLKKTSNTAKDIKSSYEIETHKSSEDHLKKTSNTARRYWIVKNTITKPTFKYYVDPKHSYCAAGRKRNFRAVQERTIQFNRNTTQDVIISAQEYFLNNYRPLNDYPYRIISFTRILIFLDKLECCSSFPDTVLNNPVIVKEFSTSPMHFLNLPYSNEITQRFECHEQNELVMLYFCYFASECHKLLNQKVTFG